MIDLILIGGGALVAFVIVITPWLREKMFPRTELPGPGLSDAQREWNKKVWDEK